MTEDSSGAAEIAAALPGAATLAFLDAAAPARLSPSDLVDAVIAAERLLAHVNAVQAELLAELGRPQRCGDVTGLVDALINKAGLGHAADGHLDDELVSELTRDRSIGVAAAELAAVLDWAPQTARIRIEQSTRLLTAFPDTLQALRQGRVDVGRVRMILDRTAALSPTQCQQIEGRILSLVKGRSKGRLETLVDREVIIADPAAAEQRRIKAVQDREVSHRVDRDGMGVITAMLPAEAAVMIFTLIDLIAEANKGLDGRTVDQRRADAITDIADELLTHGYVDLDGLITRIRPATPAPRTPETCANNANDATADDADRSDEAAPSAGEPGDPTTSGEHTRDDAACIAPGNGPAAGATAAESPEDAVTAARLARALSRHGRRPHLNVTGAQSTLAGLDDLPGHLDGHGAITAHLLRAVAASWGTLTTIGINPATGTATAVGALTYRPGQRLADQIITVHGTCRMAGCRQPAWRCDIDHNEPFDHHNPTAGGKTLLCNTLPQCKFHHLLKHHTNWTPHLQPDLTVHWTTNTGHRATSHPREFTLPGEWLCAHAEVGQPLETDHFDNPTAPDDSPDLNLIIGPTVTGPTIPIHPAGYAHTEPHTELEDPATIPDPGTVDIHPYRAQRQRLREHALRRIHRLAIDNGPTAQRRSDYIAGRPVTLHPGDLDTHTAEHAALTLNLRSANHRSSRHQSLDRPHPPHQAPDGVDLLDEPPF